MLAHLKTADLEGIVHTILDWYHTNKRARRPSTSRGPAYVDHLHTIARARQARLPHDRRAQIATLYAEGQWQAALTAAGMLADFDLADPGTELTAEGKAQVAADLRHLRADHLLWNFPLEKDGRWPLSTEVLLASYPASQPLGRDRQMWLTVASPARRRDPQHLTLQLQSRIGANFAHRWDQARWLWGDRAQSASEAERWGVTGLDLSLLGLEDRDEHTARLERKVALQTAAYADRVALCILLQDAGRFDEALPLFDVSLGNLSWNILHEVPQNYWFGDQPAAWAAALQAALSACAFWRLDAIVQADRERRAERAKQTKSRRIRPTHLRLFALPHQYQQSKIALFLTPSPEGNPGPHLELEGASINDRLPEVLWRHPLDLDMRRFGVSEGLLNTNRKESKTDQREVGS